MINSITKYSVSPKQLDGKPMCWSYFKATFLPKFALIFCATASFLTVKRNFSDIVPGIETIANSPSQVLQIKPRLENFWTYPARSPLE